MFRSYEFLEFDNILKLLVFLYHNKLAYLDYKLYFKRFIYEMGYYAKVSDNQLFMATRRILPYV